MRPGDVSDILEGPAGFYIVKMIENAPGSDLTLEAVAPRIRELLLADKMDAAVNEFCQPFLKQPGYAEVYLQLERTLATYPGLEDLKAGKSLSPEAASSGANPKETPARNAAPKTKPGSK